MFRKSLIFLLVCCLVIMLVACSASPESLARDRFKQENPSFKVTKVQPVYGKTVLLNNDISEYCTVNIYYTKDDDSSSDDNYVSYLYQKIDGQWKQTK